MSIVSGKLGGNISVTGSGMQQGYASLLVSYNFFAKYDEDGREVPLLTLKDLAINTTVDGVGDLKDVEIIIPKTVVMDGNIEFTLEGSFTFDAVKKTVSLTKNSLRLTAIDKDSTRDFRDEITYDLKSDDFIVTNSDGDTVTDFQIGNTEVSVQIDGLLGREATVTYHIDAIYINGSKMCDAVEGTVTAIVDLNGKLVEGVVVPYNIIIDEYTKLQGNITITTSNKVDAYFTAVIKVIDDYDITTEKGWIPNAMEWNNQIASPNDIDAKSIIDGTWTYVIGSKQQTGKIENTNLVTGDNIMKDMSNLTTVNSSFPKLRSAMNMFDNCYNLSSFTSDLSAVEHGGGMFTNCMKLSTLSINNFNKLVNGGSMFRGCKALSSFSYDLSKLQFGNYMFDGCDNLSTFDGDLSSLLCGYNMFSRCSLSKQSVINIANNIKDLKDFDWGSDDEYVVKVYWYETTNYFCRILKEYQAVIHIDTASDVSLDDEEVVQALNLMGKKKWTVYFNGELYEYVEPDYNYNKSGMFLVRRLTSTLGKLRRETLFYGNVDITGERYADDTGKITILLDDIASYGDFTKEVTCDITPSNTPDDGSFAETATNLMISRNGTQYNIDVTLSSVGEDLTVAFSNPSSKITILFAENINPEDAEDTEIDEPSTEE